MHSRPQVVAVVAGPRLLGVVTVQIGRLDHPRRAIPVSVAVVVAGVAAVTVLIDAVPHHLGRPGVYGRVGVVAIGGRHRQVLGGAVEPRGAHGGRAAVAVCIRVRVAAVAAVAVLVHPVRDDLRRARVHAGGEVVAVVGVGDQHRILSARGRLACWVAPGLVSARPAYCDRARTCKQASPVCCPMPCRVRAAGRGGASRHSEHPGSVTARSRRSCRPTRRRGCPRTCWCRR
jgi:hypothetical protein